MRFLARLYVFLALLWGAAAQAQVVFDAKTATVTNGNLVATLTVPNLTVGSGTNRAAAVLVWWDQGTFPTGVTATWDSGGTNQSMTQVPGTQVADGSSSVSAAIYAVVAPTSGNKSLVVSWTGSLEVHAMAISFTGVNQTSVATAFPHGAKNSGNSAGPATITITSATGNLVIAGDSQGAGSFGAVSGTTIAKDDTTGPALGVVGNYDNGAATVTLTAALPSSTAWDSLGSDILAAAGGSTCPMTRSLMGVGC
jgi:hypothetical protein